MVAHASDVRIKDADIATILSKLEGAVRRSGVGIFRAKAFVDEKAGHGLPIARLGIGRLEIARHIAHAMRLSV